MAMKVRQVVRRLRQEGYELARTRGSHAQYRSPDGAFVVTVPGRPGDTLTPGVLASIRRATGIGDIR